MRRLRTVVVFGLALVLFASAASPVAARGGGLPLAHSDGSSEAAEGAGVGAETANEQAPRELRQDG